MANVYRILVSHHVAHIEPTLDSGTATAGFPVGNCRTLDPLHISRLGGTLRIDWDRGGTGRNNVNGLFIGGYTTQGSGPYLYADTAATFATPTTLIDAASFAAVNRHPVMYCFADNNERYLRLAWSGITDVPFAVISIGRQYLVGREFLRQNQSGGGNSSRAVQKQFRLIAHDTLDEIMALWGRRWIHAAQSSESRDALGGDAGAGYTALGEFASTASPNQSIMASGHHAWYGHAQLRASETFAAVGDLTVALENVLDVAPAGGV